MGATETHTLYCFVDWGLFLQSVCTRPVHDTLLDGKKRHAHAVGSFFSLMSLLMGLYLGRGQYEGLMIRPLSFIQLPVFEAISIELAWVFRLDAAHEEIDTA